MIVETPPDFRTVEDYDIESITGNSLTVTIDPTLGDSIDMTDSTITICVAPRPSQTDPTQKTAAETTTINKAHVFAVRKRTREILNRSTEAQREWEKTFQEMGSRMH